MEPILSPEEWLAKQPKDEAKSSILSPEDWLAKKKEPEGGKQLPQSDDSSDLARALFTNQLPQLQETYGAAKVLTGKALGDKEMMQSGMETMKAGQKQQVHKESDELSKAWEMGIGTVLTDWLPYQVGAGLGSLAESLAMAGIGAGVGAVTGAGVGSVPGAAAGFLSKQLVKKGIKEAAEAVIQKELKEQLANKVAKKEAKQLAEEAGQKYIEAETKNLLTDLAGESAKAAAKKGAVAYGTTAGMAGQATLHGMGEPTSRAIQEEQARAAKEGRQFNVEDLDMSRLGPAAIVHGLADFVTEKITLGAVKGLPKPSSGSFAKDLVTHMFKTGVKEFAPEEIQTAAERFGAKLSLTDAEALTDYLNTAGASFVMGAIPGGVGGARTYLAGKQAKEDVKDAVEKDADTTAKVEADAAEGKDAVQVAQETLDAAPPAVANQAVQGTLNTVPTPEIDTKIDEVTAKIKEVEDTIEGGENLSREDYAAYYRELDRHQAQLDALLEQKAAAQQTGEATTGQELSALATKIKESEQAPQIKQDVLDRARAKVANLSPEEVEKQIADLEPRVASGESKNAPHKANMEAKLAALKERRKTFSVDMVDMLGVNNEEQQRETQDVTQPDTGAVGVGTEVPVGPAVDINAPAAETPTVGGLGEVSGAESVAVRGPEEQQAALEAAAPTAEETAVEPEVTAETEAAVEPTTTEETAVEPEVAAEAKAAPVAPPTAVQKVKMRRDPSGNDYQVTMDNGQTNFIYRDTSGVWRLDTAGYKVPVESQLGWVSDELGKNKKEALAALPGKLQQLEKYRVQEAPAAKPAPAAKEAKVEKPAPKAKREEGPRTVSRLTAALQDAVQNNATLQDILAIIADRGLNDWPSATYAQNLLTLLDRPMGLINVRFAINKVGKSADGKFEPKLDRITLKGENNTYTGTRPLDQTILHEVMHYLTDHVVDNMVLYLRSIPPGRQSEVKAAYRRLDQNYKRAVEAFGDKYNIGSIKEFIAEVFTNPALQRDMASLKIGEGQLSRVSLFARVAEAIANMLGLAKGQGVALRQSLEDVASLISPVGEVKAKEISYSEPKTVSEGETAKAILDAGEIDIRNIRDPQNNSYARHLLHIPKNYITEAIKLFFTRAGWRRIVHNVQNERYEVKRLETMMDRAGKTIYTGPDTNAVYTMFTRATGIGRNLFNDYVAPLQDRLQKQIRAYAKAEGIDVSGALHNLHRILEAIHEPERRLVKYILTVPLKPKAETIRKNIVDKLNSTTAKLDKKDLIKMRARLDALVLDFDANGHVIPNLRNIDEIAAKDPATGRDDTLIESDKYIVAGEYATSSDIASRLSKYESMEHKQLVDDIAETMAKLHRVTTILNRKAHFWSTPVSNRVGFYGWQHYMPLKGVPHSEVDEYLDFDSERLGRDLQQSQAPMVGREKSTSENPLLQTLSDAVSASLRAGRKDLTLAIKNAVDQGYIAGDTKLKISFEERQNPDILKKLPRENTVFHYGADGSITVVQIHDKAMREAIRRTYRQNSLPVEIGNYITSLMGQMHTRYNYKFAPLNFVRDALTNAWTMGAQLGPMKSVKLISRISAQMVNGSMISKATRIARAYAINDGEAINKFKKSSDPYVKNIMEFLQEGGMVEYIQGVSLKSNFQKLHKDINRGSATRAKEVVDAIADIWTDTFEIASRAAAYSVAKSTFINDQKMDEKSARVKAAAFTKNLANFEEVGKHGKRWGAAFMFFRPAATGAVRAVEALLPAVTPVSKALSDLPPSLRNDKEAVAEFKKNYAKQQKNARYMTAALMGLGAATYLMAEGMSDDDDIGRNRVASDDIGLWARNARFFIPGMEKPVQIPWGFGMGAWASLGAQMMAISRGNGNFGDLLNGVLQVTMDSFLPIPVSRMSINTAEDLPSNIVDTLTPSLLRPMLEFVMNKNGLGNQIYNDTNKRMGDAYLGSDNTPQIYKDVAVLMVEATNGGINISPNTLYFYTNSYIDGPARFVDATADMFYALDGQKSFDSDMLRQAPIIGSFVGSAPNVDARLYSKAEQKILRMDADMKMFESKPEQYLKYINNNPMAPSLVATYNSTKPTLDALRHEANVIRGLGLSPKETKAILDANKMSQNLIKYSIVETFKGLDVKP